MAASGEFFRYPMEGCLSGCDGIIDQRPYHRNCKCELHKNNNKSRKHNCPNGAGNGSIVSYPIRRSWSEGCLALSSFSSPASSPGYGANDSSAPLPPSIPGKMLKKQQQQLRLHRQGSVTDDEDDDDLFPQIKMKN